MSKTKVWQVFYFVSEQGEIPFADWLTGIKDPITRKRILSRIRRLENGNFGDCKFLEKGVSELRLFFGPGYRVYFGKDEEKIVVLLCGGDKTTQDQDIKTAQTFWQEYLSWKQKE